MILSFIVYSVDYINELKGTLNISLLQEGRTNSTCEDYKS